MTVIIYNVTIKVAQPIADEWVRWMREEHMDDLVATGLFTGSRLSRLLEQDETDGITYIAQYFCDSLEDYNDYLKEHAGAMREKGLKKFGARIIAFRTVMEVLR